MRSLLLTMVCLSSLVGVPSRAQQTQEHTQAQSTSQQAPNQPVLDPQALALVNQVLSTAGGTTPVLAVSDYVSTGNVTFTPANGSLQGSVTIRGRGISQFRMDSNVSGGLRTWIISADQTIRKTEDGKVFKAPPSETLNNSNGFPYQGPMFPAGLFFPLLQLATALNTKHYNVFDKGIVQLNGQSVREIQVQRLNPASSKVATAFVLPTGIDILDGKGRTDLFGEANSVDFFIDPATQQVVMIQDVIPRHILHKLVYSDYRNVNGILMPFSISEQTGNQTSWVIQLNQIACNQGLQDSDFALAP